jgi:farnesyl-diphosphate farnesyltransferase
VVNKKDYKDAMNMLKATSRTFYIPITFLEKDLKDAVASAYLILRAVDEIEDHPDISNDVKYTVLLQISELFKQPFDENAYASIIAPIKDILPDVSIRLGDWIKVCPEAALPAVMEHSSETAYGMSKWSKLNWEIHTREDLDEYTYYVAGLVGVMLSDLWSIYGNEKTDRDLAIGYGRGLQAVNILRNEQEDLDERKVSFVPDDWTRDDLFEYAEANLAKADEYIKAVKKRSIKMFCRLPLVLAHKTLKAMKSGREKVSREEVEQSVKEVQDEA